MDNHSSVTLWGSGSPMREFLHVDDLASAVVFALQNTLDEHLYNVGSGSTCDFGCCWGVYCC